jgi:hypothetical protein
MEDSRLSGFAVDMPLAGIVAIAIDDGLFK